MASSSTCATSSSAGGVKKRPAALKGSSCSNVLKKPASVAQASQELFGFLSEPTTQPLPPTSSLKKELYILNEANVDLLQFDFWNPKGGLDLFMADKNFFKKKRTPPAKGCKEMWELRIREKDDDPEDAEIQKAFIQSARFVRWVSPKEFQEIKRRTAH